jgi:RecA/RadA recombinase
MSTEVLAICAVVDEGASALRKLYGASISSKDFIVYDEEFKWLERRFNNRKTVNRRVFQQRFPDFEWMRPTETVQELAAELRDERAYEQVANLIETLGQGLERDNAVELAIVAREQLSAVTRSYAPAMSVDLDDYEGLIEEMKQGFILARQGLSQGIPTGFAHLDHHWGGFMPGQFIGVLGRTGEGKSFLTTEFAWATKRAGFKVGLFTPEMSKHEVRCRYHTLASADKKIQQEVGLRHAFRNRALMFRHGFNLKSYKLFCEYLKQMPGRFHLLSGTNMAQQMTVGYIEDRIVELELDLVIIDPIYLLKPVRTTAEGNVYQEIAWVAEAIHHLSELYNIPIVFTNQAHMEGGSKDDAPHKDRSFGAKALMHLTDYVLGVKNVSEENRMIVRGSKSRFGADFRFEMGFWPNIGKFQELTPLKGDYWNGHEEADEEELREMIEAATTEEARV